MSIAIMQPYFFPYVGYFQLVYATDMFVFYDDVNFINRGWINRNRILINGKDQMITVPCKDASQNKLIMDIEVADDPKSMNKMLATIQMAYKKAPFFADVFPVIQQTIEGHSHSSIAKLSIDSVVNICSYLGLNKIFKQSSREYDNRELKKADRLIDICHIEGIRKYINPYGGKEIYTKEYYSSKGVDLYFISPLNVDYPQFNNTFVPWLSMIDVLMFNSIDDINTKILSSFILE